MTVIAFPHGRASIGSSTKGGLAAKAVKSSAVKTACLALSVDNTEAHHSAGIASRCHHLDTVQADVPTANAIASRDGHSSMIDRKDNSAIPNSLGQTVLKCKAILSCDGRRKVGQSVPMPKLSETEENNKYIQRVRDARRWRFPTQNPILTLLEIPQDQYKHYEKRTPLPRRFIPKFCAATGADILWLLTGEGKAPWEAAEPTEPKKRTRRALKGKVA